jgi:hypothetical protein
MRLGISAKVGVAVCNGTNHVPSIENCDRLHQGALKTLKMLTTN